MKNIKIILTSKPNYLGASIEAGKDDGVTHFDHHGEFSSNPSPCNNKNISVINTGIIEITHIDADSLLGIARLVGKSMPKIDLDLLEKIDLNGSSIITNKYNETLLYSIGIGSIVRELKFPRVTEERQDVTQYIEQLLNMSEQDIIKKGEIAQNASEEAYKTCVKAKEGNKILFFTTGKESLNPSRAYEDGFDKVVVYRDNWKTISLYCNPKSDFSFGGKTIAGIEFGGHPKACGSPRGQQMSWEQTEKVFSEI